jgi:hypothetical protein
MLQTPKVRPSANARGGSCFAPSSAPSNDATTSASTSSGAEPTASCRTPAAAAPHTSPSTDPIRGSDCAPVIIKQHAQGSSGGWHWAPRAHPLSEALSVQDTMQALLALAMQHPASCTLDAQHPPHPHPWLHQNHHTFGHESEAAASCHSQRDGPELRKHRPRANPSDHLHPRLHRPSFTHHDLIGYFCPGDGSCTWLAALPATCSCLPLNPPAFLSACHSTQARRCSWIVIDPHP